MSRKNVIHKDWLYAKKLLKDFNNRLYEDVFKNRFKATLTGNKRDFSTANYLCYCPELLNAENAGDPTWRYSEYEIKIEDTEEPERSFNIWCRLSDSFGLIDCYAATEEDHLKSMKYFRNTSGLKELWTIMNNFIIYSDFWEKWNDIEYQKTHWYTGECLKEMVAYSGPEYTTPEGAERARKERDKKRSL